MSNSPLAIKARAIRSPVIPLRRERPSVRTRVAQGSTVDPESVTLEGDGLKPLTKTKEVNAKIIEIIGLDKDQFEETMMIAQGGFQKLINADTKDRRDIFRKILKTDDLSRLKDQLKAQDSEATEKVKNQNNKILGLLQAFQSEDPSWLSSLSDKYALNSLDNFIQSATLTVASFKERLPSLEADSKAAELAKTSAIERREAAIHFNALKTDYLKALKDSEDLALQKDGIEEKRTLVDLAHKAERVLSAKKPYEQTQADLQAAESEKARLQEQLPLLMAKKEEKAKALEEQKPLLEQRSQAITGELTELNRKKDLFAKVASAGKEHNQAFNALQNGKTAYSQAKKAKEDSERFINEIQAKYAHFEDTNHREQLKGELDLLQQKEETILSIKAKGVAYQKLVEATKAQQATYLAFKKAYETSDALYQDALSRFLNGQAGLLASSLKEGQACPVCGSLDHPHLAASSKEVPSQETVEALKTKRETAEKSLREAAQTAQGASSSADTYLQGWAQDFKNAFNEELVLESVSSRLETLSRDSKAKEKELSAAYRSALQALEKRDQDLALSEKKQSELTTKLIPGESLAQENLLTAQKNEAGTLEALKGYEAEVQGLSEASVLLAVQSLQKEQKELSEKQNRLQNEANSVATDYSGLSAKVTVNASQQASLMERIHTQKGLLDSALSESGFLSVEDAEKSALSPSTITAYEQEIRSYDDASSRNKALIAKGQESHCDTEALKDMAVLDQEVQVATEKANEATSKYNALGSELKTDEGILSEVAKVKEEAKADLQKALDLHELYLTATGQLSGAPHIDFEVYYQAQLFDEILDSASKKLNDMTDGRYVFARRKAPLSGVGQFGLEIDVIDFNTGKERPVSTLSGGESFMASLALALSLSEIIQQKAGGIELDSMFVDEGFGTLDPESLDNAIRILTNLSNNGHRLVGIISHVEALQSSIPLQIIVNKGKDGSTIKIVV
jgi:exonuclease SbcC